MSCITTQNDLLLKNLLTFYKKDNNLNKMLKIINGESKISLRIVDWFATNYAKKMFTIYNIDNKRFKVYDDYKLKLKAYSKRRFDPFCRWDRITIPYDDSEENYIQTTIGQLNFFKWAINNHILEYIIMNYKSIENDMNISYNNINKKKNKDVRKKRQEISKSATRGLNTYNVKVLIDFD